jgi:Uma2 family endonuclease
MMTTLVIPTSAAVNGPPQGHWTYADWETLSADGNRYEIVDGVLYMTTAPSYFHQWIVRRLDRFVGVPAEEQGLAFAATAPIGLLMPGCDPVQPDFVVVLAARADIIRERRIQGVPDLIIEVLSPGSVAYDERVKLTAYAGAGVAEYAIVSPEERQLSLYQLETPGRYKAARVFTGQDTVSFACLPPISFLLNALFAGAPHTTV